MLRWILTAVLSLATMAVNAQQTVPLHTWYSPSRGDYFTTSDPFWAGRTGDRKSPDYTFVRVEGQVFNPASPHPDGIPLYSWWNPQRGDNFLTSDPAWRGRPGDVKDGYSLTRIEGYVYRTPLAGTVPLQTFWNRETQDNYASSDAMYGHGRTPRGYVGPTVAGYILPAEQRVSLTAANFGYDTLRVNNRSARGRRPLLVLLVEFADARFRTGRDRAYYDRLMFGPGFPNIADYFSEISSNQFTWQSAGTVGPILMADDPSTPRNESMYSDGMFDEVVDGATRSEGRRAAAHAILRAAAGGTDLARYDSNRDGTVTSDELCVVVILAGPGENLGGAQRWALPHRVELPGAGVALQTDVALFGDGATFRTMAHEVFHMLGAGWDLYSTGFHSSGLTLMSDTSGGREDLTSIHLDPWYKMRMGWVEPRVIPLNDAGDVAQLAAPQLTGGDRGTAHAQRPILLYDPARGPGEFFLLEFRSATAGGYDRDMRDWRGQPSGVAVWSAKVDAAYNPLSIPGIKINGKGRVDSVVRGNDFAFDADSDGTFDWIEPGPDRELQSVPSGDDAYWNDNAMFIRGGVNGNRGDAVLLRPLIGMSVDWIRTPAVEPSVPALRVRAGGGTDATRTWIEWSRGNALIPRIDYSAGSGAPGSTLTLTGAFGVAQGSRIVSLQNDDLGRFTLEVTSWSPNQILARMPAGVPPGTYSLLIYGDSTRTTQSNWRPFEVPR